jgi:hypothetical protein
LNPIETFQLQIVFAAALAGVVATQLDYQTVKAGAPTQCLLNSKGQVCVFTYITAGAIMFFTLLTIIPVFIFYRRGAALHPVYLSLASFSFFWQLVMAITITIRGGQAQDSGLPQQGARDTAWAFAWLGVALTFISAIVITLDIIREHEAAKHLKRSLPSDMSMKIDVSLLHKGVGVGQV